MIEQTTITLAFGKPVTKEKAAEIVKWLQKQMCNDHPWPGNELYCMIKTTVWEDTQVPLREGIIYYDTATVPYISRE